MSKILFKVLDKAIFPAATLVVSKVFGLYLATQIYHFEWFVKSSSTTGSVFSVRFVFESPQAANLVNTFSNVFMYLVLFGACVLVLLRAYYLHSTHQSPRVIARLAKANLLNLISDTQEILADAFVWYTALWIATAVCILSVVNNNAELWIAPVAFIFSLYLSTSLVTDMDKEVDSGTLKKVNS